LFIRGPVNKTKQSCGCSIQVRILRIIFLVLFISSTGLIGQSIQKIDGDGIAALSKLSNDTTYVLNFWATWCSPCVKEIPIFEKLHQDVSGQKVKVILVSLDFVKQLDSRVIPFLEEKGISAEVKIVTDTDYNSWIDRVDPSWSGAIPATLIYNKDRRVFLEKELSYNELFTQIQQIQQ
jgi:thiol-disulfide isomerase/thioredoxin